VIFVDTSFFFALLSEDDPDHARALEVFDTFEGRKLPDLLLTTNHVVFETVTLARARAGHDLAVEAGEMLYSEKMARIHQATPEEERLAFAYLKQYRDKNYSAVDCLSFVVMEKLDITEALALDADFTHRFTIRPR
jgi:predicted nucleic acid-binding protein